MNSTTKKRKSLLKVKTEAEKRRDSDSENTGEKKKKVDWDYAALEEQEKEMLRNPRMKIDEPKTPYAPFEEDGDEYLKQLNEINKLRPTVSLI